MLRRGAIAAIGAAALCLASAAITQAQPAAQSNVPRVRLVATGGTISNRNGGRLTAEELVKSMPGIDRYAQPEFEQFTNLASSELTLDQWVALSKRINELFRTDSGLAGVVVTSGTDTLEELAYFLDLTVRSEKPVVVVGSMRNPSTLGYEGAANLLEGFRVAAAPGARNKGVLVVLNDEINSAREATKTDALRLQTFQTRGYGLLGVVDSDRVVFYRDVVKRHTAKSEFDITGVTKLPRVDVIWVYQGADGDLIKAAVDAGAQGIVIAGAGAGATSGTQPAGITYALQKGAVVVSTTRTGSGRIAPQRGGGRGGPPAGATATGAAPPANPNNPNAALTPEERARRVAGEDLAPVKARLLLMMALTKTKDGAEIQRMFSEY
ncbi:MAG: asparaginase [Acidobacteriia bacterium]|nr:asparaginase [Terriglobia bacterium]